MDAVCPAKTPPTPPRLGGLFPPAPNAENMLKTKDRDRPFPPAPKAENILKTKDRDWHFSLPKAENMLKTKLLIEFAKRKSVKNDKMSKPVKSKPGCCRNQNGIRARLVLPVSGIPTGDVLTTLGMDLGECHPAQFLTTAHGKAPRRALGSLEFDPDHGVNYRLGEGASRKSFLFLSFVIRHPDLERRMGFRFSRVLAAQPCAEDGD